MPLCTLTPHAAVQNLRKNSDRVELEDLMQAFIKRWGGR